MKEFSKKDLKNGMIVKFRGGRYALLINGGFRNIYGNEGLLKNYENDLTFKFKNESDKYDIIEVYDFNSNADIKDILNIIHINYYEYLSEFIDKKYVKLIWERERKIDWWNKVPMWTRVLVRNNNKEDWTKAYFLYESNNDDYPYCVTICDRFTYNEVFDKCYSQIKPFDENDINEEWYFKEDGENANE